MSQSKNTRSKRKPLPNEISVSLKTPKSRQFLFSNGSVSNLDDEAGTTPLKRSKRKKLRKTQNYFSVDDEGNQESSSSVSSISKTRKKVSSRSSANSEVDGNISSEVFLESEEKPKSKRSRKKKIKLPVVNLDDFGSLDNTLQYSEENISSEKKNASIDSISSSTSNVNNENENSSKKKSKKKKSTKREKKQEDIVMPKTRSSRKAAKDKDLKNISEIDENKENIVIENCASPKKSSASKKRRRNCKPELVNEADEVEENIEMLSNEHSRSSKKRRIRSEITNETEGFKTTDNQTGAKSRSSSRKKRRIKSEIINETDDTQLNDEKTGPEHSEIHKRSKRTTTLQIADETKELKENIEAIVENTPSRRSKQIFHSEAVDETGELGEDIEKLGNELPEATRKSSRILKPEFESKTVEWEENIEKFNVKQSRTSRKTSQILKTDSPKKSIEGLSNDNSKTPSKSEHFLNSEITDNSEKQKANTTVDISRMSRKSCQLLNPEFDDKSIDLKNNADNVRNSKSRRSWKLLSNETNLQLEENTDKINIEIPTTSRKSWQILNSEKITDEVRQEDNFDSTDNLGTSSSTDEILSPKTTDDSEDVEKNMDKSHFKNSSTLRRSWQILSTEITGKTKEVENIERSIVQNLRTSRKIEHMPSPKTNNETEHAGINTTRPHFENSSTSRKSEQILNLGATIKTVREDESIDRPRTRNSRNVKQILTPNINDKTEEMKENNKKVHVENSRISRRSWQVRNSEIKDEARELEEDIDSLEMDEVVKSINESSLSVGRLKHEKDEIQLHNNSIMSNLKSPFRNRKSPVEQKSRKRWTILNGDDSAISGHIKANNEEEATIEGKLEINNTSSKRRSIKEIIEPSTNEISNKGSFIIDHEDLDSSMRPLDTSKKSAISIQKENSFNLDSTFVKSSSADNSLEEKNSVSEPENCNIITPDRSLRRYSKRYSKSLDFIEGILPLEQTSTLENSETTINEKQTRNSRYGKPSTPGSILKRRGTYDLDVSVTDVSILKSVSEGNLSNTGLPSEDNSEETNKNVRFQHVTKRKPCLRRNDYLNSPENKPDASARKVPPKIGAANKSVSFDQTIFSASSCSTSTPLHPSKKNNLLKQILTKNSSKDLSNKRRSRSVEEKREKCVNRIKMPNFTKIHQRWNDKLEDISQMAARKAERARLLLSGQKPSVSSTSSSNESERKKDDKTKHPKHLNFTKSQQIPNIGNNRTPNISKTKKQSSPKKFKVEDKSKKQVIVANIPSGKSDTATSKNLLMKSGIPKKLQSTKPTQNVLKRTEEIKCLATKSKPQHDTKEERRTILKGVRGNRRFELLMKMRNK
ncbi:probable serine/threonine-protein kinase ndrD isoform X2 [Coccinella septempunctata]|uniref:probable serine/threonine-protein kinase ndrD isoform X2 n=1 Tax=Coccinella septempunctata TaxID=41139 RepID=UPI001D080D2B|nr:probable serine/threonine-protein kinase ndrD isoform X2 [Coccinella septempunctata]